jgi:hypothetical protein
MGGEQSLHLIGAVQLSAPLKVAIHARETHRGDRADGHCSAVVLLNRSVTAGTIPTIATATDAGYR